MAFRQFLTELHLSQHSLGVRDPIGVETRMRGPPDLYIFGEIHGHEPRIFEETSRHYTRDIAIRDRTHSAFPWTPMSSVVEKQKERAVKALLSPDSPEHSPARARARAPQTL